MVTTVQSYHRALSDLVLAQELRRQLSKPRRETPAEDLQQQQHQPANPQSNSNGNSIALKRPKKTFQLFIAHLQPKRNPPLRIKLLRRLYKRRKKLESNEFKAPRIRPSRVWSVT